MPAEVLPTGNPEALRIFVAGSQQFRSYLASGNVSLLKQARTSFTSAAALDPKFQLALFYRSLVQTELREADSAINGFRVLLGEGVQFRTEVLIHLAYAHVKRYTDADYDQAESLLDQAKAETAQGQPNLRLLIDALRVFVYAVMGGRLKDLTRRPAYLDRALHLGMTLLQGELGSPVGADQAEARFEVLNGLGIALMYKGSAADDDADKRKYWAESEARYRQALALRPMSVRAMQNFGSLRGYEALKAAHAGDIVNANLLFEQAKDLFLQSIALNSNDQYPHYRMSKLSALTGDWPSARDYYNSGRTQNGAVKDEEWKELDEAITWEKASDLRW